jgi:methyl-accepting chemotaxis protein
MRQLTDRLHYFFGTSAPQVRGVQQALLALEDANTSLGFALAVNQFEHLEDIRLYEAKFNHSILQFEVFIDALTYGSETDEFRTHNGGLIYSEWQRQGYAETYVLAPLDGQEAAIIKKLDVFTSPLISNIQGAFSLKKKILRLQSTGYLDQVPGLEAELNSLLTTVKENKEEVGELMDRFIAERDVSVENELIAHEALTDRMYLVIFVVVSINFLIALGLGVLLARRMVLTPIRNLTQVVKDISTGKLDSKIDPKALEANNEIGELARAFDRTVVSLKLAMRVERAKSTTDVVAQEINPSKAS